MSSAIRTAAVGSDRRPIRVAYVVYRFDVGGLERCVANLCNHLDRERFEPLVVCLDRSGTAAAWLERDDVEVVELRKRAGNDLAVIRRLARALRERRVDVVHSHNWGTLVETSVGRRWGGVKGHVHTEHGQGLHDEIRGLRRLARRNATRWAFARADAVIVCAESVRPLVADRSGFPGAQIRFMPNGVPDPLLVPCEVTAGDLRGRLKIAPAAIVIGSVGRLVPVKDFRNAIEATSRLPENVHLVLVGDGPEESTLRDDARRLGIASRVHLAGRQTNVGDWLRLFDVYVNSSRSEAMSMGILEALGAGLPVVATDVGENRVLVEGSTPCGLIVPPGRSDVLAAAMTRVISCGSMRAECGANGRNRFVEQYSSNCMAREHERLYCDLIGPHGTGSETRRLHAESTPV